MGNFQEAYEQQERVKKVREALDFLRRNSESIPMALESTHRTEQQLTMKKVIVVAIKHWSEVLNDKERLRYDDRNEATVKVCDRIVREIDTLDGLPLI